MRNYLAILAFLGVGVLSIFLMPRSVFASIICDAGAGYRYNSNNFTSGVSMTGTSLCKTGSLDSKTIRSFDVVMQNAGTFRHCLGGTLYEYSGLSAGLNHVISNFSAVASTSVYKIGMDCSNVQTVSILKSSWGSGTKLAMVFYDDELGDESYWSTSVYGYSPLYYNAIVGTYTASTTRFVSLDSPQNYEATSTAVTISGSYYLNSADADVIPSAFGFQPAVMVILTNTEIATGTKVMYIPIDIADSVQFFSTTTVLLDNSRYTLSQRLVGNNRETISDGTFQTEPDLSFYQFTTGSFDPESGQNFDLSSCNVLSGFDASQCVYGLIYPNPTVFSALFNQLKISYGRAIPIGYVTRFAEILTSTSSSALPVISATIPNGVVGAGSVISLDPNNALDFVLNATTSSFVNSSASSSESFYVITNRYWTNFISLLFVLYIVRRIIGSHLII